MWILEIYKNNREKERGRNGILGILRNNIERSGFLLEILE
jgi:hypothetical protein